MNPLPVPKTIADQYDRCLRYAKHGKVPLDQPIPQSTRCWPPENIALLEKYTAWLLGGGASPDVTRKAYMPMAGHVLGLSLRPHRELDLRDDLEAARTYIRAKGLNAEWTKLHELALARFRRFLLEERGIPAVRFNTFRPEEKAAGLPGWLVRELGHFIDLRQSRWRPARREQNQRQLWGDHIRTWRFLQEQCGVTAIRDLKRAQVHAFTRHLLEKGYAVSGINSSLRNLSAFLAFLREEGHPVPQALQRVPTLRQPDRLPRFLTDEQVSAMKSDLESRVKSVKMPHTLRDALLDRAAFYLMWQGGLRVSEVEELCLEDLILAEGRLTVREGKGLKDRTVYLTGQAISAIVAYLAVRGDSPYGQVFLYRNRPARKDLLPARIRACGQRVGVRVHPHRLRHTFATQLLNAGANVTTIQQLLGHRDLNSTMIYARVHDHNVAKDYYSAMKKIEDQR
jgi:integrase/recombinase XerC